MKKKLFALLAVGAIGLTFTACGPKNSGNKETKSSETSTSASATTNADGSKDVAGITEIPVGDSGPQSQGPLEVNAVYFQAIDMEQGSSMMPPASESDMHFEIDIKTNDKAKEFGFDADQFMPYLDVDATLTNKDNGKKVELGTMMPMIASDGPHYGNNVKVPAGNYDVTVTIKSPADKFMLHTGKDSSAVSGRFWKEPLKFHFNNWQWSGEHL